MVQTHGNFGTFLTLEGFGLKPASVSATKKILLKHVLHLSENKFQPGE